MSVLRLVRDIHDMSDLPAALTPDPWATATEAQRRTAALREVLIAPLAELVRGGSSINNAAGLLAAQIECRSTSDAVAQALAQLGADAVSLPTLKRWLSDYVKRGQAGLLPAHTGRVRQDYGWEMRAVALYASPSKPGLADVASRLRQEGFDSATDSRVARYVKALPATLGKHGPARVGQHLHKLTRRNYQRRHTDELLVGEVYAGDGHTCDCYVAHPNTGGPFRPELTTFIDIKSKYIVGWWLTESESAVSTLYALSHAMRTHDHVPGWLYIDRGAGYRASMLADECTGWYSRFDMQVIGALPGNPHGKGWIERWFREMRDKHDKFFADGLAYCGDDMADEINRRMSVEVKAGRRTLPSLAQYVESLAAWIDHYHREPMDVLGGRSPAQVWAELQRVPVGHGMDAVMRPREKRTVQRQCVRVHNRTYYHEALALYDAKAVHVEYDLHDDKHAWVFDTKGRFVCQAALTQTISVLPTSRLEEQRQKRLQGQIKRLERHADEARARTQDVLTVADTVQQIEEVTGSIVEPLPAAPNPYDIDLTDWSE